MSGQAGKDVIYEMVKQADVVLENFKSGSIDRLGLGYDKLKEINPKIVFVSLSGFGGSGPLQKYPCYDAIAAARGGFAGSNGEPEGAPMKAGNANCDTLTGTYAFNAAVMGLIEVQKTGVGCRIDIGMTDVAMYSCAETVMDYGQTGEIYTRFGNHDRFVAPYGIFEARDGWAVIIADTQQRFEALFDVLGLEKLKEDVRFSDNAARIKNRDVLAGQIESVTRTMFRRDIEERLLAADVPASQVLPFIETYTSEHANATEVTQLVWQEKIGNVRFYNNPLRFNNELCPIKRGAPLLGEDTDEILKSVGYSEEEIARLHRDEVVASHLY